MFERYTEKARRVIFFARVEASEHGSAAIESEHLLLALLREDKAVSTRYRDARLNEEDFRAAIGKLSPPRAPNPTSVDLPLSNECKYILQFGAEEADRLKHTHIGSEHLLLGILREGNCLAAQLLRERGLTLERARAMLSTGAAQGIGGTIGSGSGSPRYLPTTIDVVDAESSELLLSYQHSALIPRIGETILVHKEGSPDCAYQVRDVVWEFNRNAGGSSLKDVIVGVRREGVPTSQGQKRPILSVTIDAKTEDERQRLEKALEDLVQQDPAVAVSTGLGSAQIVLSGMDELHLQRICDRIVGDDKLQLDVGRPTVIYLETVRKRAEAEGRYIRKTGGSGNYGHVKLRIEPNESGTVAENAFVSDITGGVLPEQYCKAAERGVREALRGGVLAGYELVNVKVTLFDGSYHDVDSNEMAFAIAGSMALREAARKGSPVVLEPVMAVEAVAPEALVGSVFADISRRRGRIEKVEQRGASQVVHGVVPLAEMLRSSEHGRPDYSMRFLRYEPTALRGGFGDNEGSVSAHKPRGPAGRGGSAAARPHAEFE